MDLLRKKDLIISIQHFVMIRTNDEKGDLIIMYKEEKYIDDLQELLKNAIKIFKNEYPASKLQWALENRIPDNNQYIKEIRNLLRETRKWIPQENQEFHKKLNLYLDPRSLKS